MGQVTMSIAEIKAAVKRKANKYRAKPVTIEGLRFDSKLEARRYGELKLMEAAGEIKGLRRCVRGADSYQFRINGVLVTSYTPDFLYHKGGEIVREDVKSKPTRTRDYVIRKKLMLAVYGITIREWPEKGRKK